MPPCDPECFIYRWSMVDETLLLIGQGKRNSEWKYTIQENVGLNIADVNNLCKTNNVECNGPERKSYFIRKSCW
ncbi:hypothetical protein DPMN_127055 [Dreissena polymorpha]|uniref:Uncharacterized protein n=1 Tax=Dreissena polymorpha TaxID=45954 RepID=A0A9D4H4H7_DREPO|nr:hypothetical protein DPMN_127055 [Dreissena polymorpha]